MVPILMPNEMRTPTMRMAFQLLNKVERLKLVFMFGLVLAGVILETISIGLVVPIVGLLTQEQPLQNYPRLNDWLGAPSTSALVSGGLFFICLVYSLKTGLIVWTTWLQKSFNTSVNLRVGSDLYRNYLHKEYSFFLNNNSAELIKNVQSSNGLMVGTVEPFLNILSDTCVGIFIVAFLFYLEPVGTLMILGLFGISSLLIRKISSQRIERWGVDLNQRRASVIKSLQQGFGGAKDIKILGKESFFVNNFEVQYSRSLEVQKKFTVIQMLPRAVLELITVVGVSLLVIVMVAKGTESNEILSVLGLFGVAAFRITPALNRVITNFQLINLSKPQIQDTYRALSVASNDEGAESCELNDVAIDVSNVSFAYESSGDYALTDVCVSVQNGEAVGLVGASGSGKSTLIDLILGLQIPLSGSVRVGGQELLDVKKSWQRIIGYIPQTIFLMDDSLRRNIALGIADSEIDEVAIVEALKSAQLEDFVASLPEGLDTVVGERGVRLSGGQRQRIGIARALYHRPSVLVLDEATSSLDTETEKGVMQAVQALQGDKTVIIVAHRLSTVEYCDRLYRLDAGRIVDEGTFYEVMNRSQS
jgi:ABC-type bacteriocin/lantibiotic exporter with double-glycine peptidase domain